MPLGQPDPSQIQPASGGMGIQTLLKFLTGAGLKNMSKSALDFANLGTDIKPILSDPMITAGVGAEAMGIPPDMILSFLQPPAPPEAQKPQIPMSALLPALTAKLGPGRTGLQAGPGAIPPPSMGAPPMGPMLGPVSPPMGLPPMPPPPIMGGI